MNDTFGREILEGQLVALAGSSCSAPFLSVGRVLGNCKKGDGIRVEVFHSSSSAFHEGLRSWRTKETKRDPKKPYVATFQNPDRVLILSDGTVPQELFEKTGETQC